MDETINKGILIAVGVIATLIVASLVFMGVKFGRQTAGSSFQKIGNMNQQAETEEYTQYIGERVTGNQALSLISQWSQYPLTVTIGNAKFDYTKGDENAEANAKELAKIKSRKDGGNDYVDPNAKYDISGTPNKDGSYSEIKFTKVK